MTMNADPRPAAVSAPAGEATPHDPTYFTDALFEAAKILGNTHGLDTKLMGAAHLLRHYAELARSPAPASGAPGEEVTERVRRDWRYGYLSVSSEAAEAEALSSDGDLAAERVENTLTMLGSRGSAGLYLYNTALIAMRRVLEDRRSLATRLAAAERAGVALREALLGDDPTMPRALQPLATIEAAIALACDMAIRDGSESDEDSESVWSVLMDARQACQGLRAALTPTGSAPSPTKED